MQMQHFPVVLRPNNTARGTTVPHRWGGEKQAMRPRIGYALMSHMFRYVISP